MAQQGFRTLNNNPYVYQDIDSGVSMAYGIDSSTNLIKLKTQSTINATPTGTANITIDPAAVGDITLTPNGAGRVIIDNNLTVSAGTIVFGSLAAARPCTVRSSPSGQLSTLIDSVVDGQLLISSSIGTPIWASLTSLGGTVAITPGHNTINLELAGGTGLIWNAVPGNTVTLAADNGYMLNNAGLTTATLPALCAVGKVIKISGSGTGLFTIAQNAGQSISLGTSSTTVGVTGSISSSNQYDALELLCVIADTKFSVLSSVGNFTLA